MPPGGARVGAGRKVGGKNRMAAEAVEKGKITGQLPHEFLLEISQGRFEYTVEVEQPIYKNGKPTGEFETVTVKRRPNMEMRVDCAKAAAPYYASKLATIEVKNPKGEDFRVMQIRRTIFDPSKPDEPLKEI